MQLYRKVLANQPVTSESERARNQYRSAAVTLPVSLSFSVPFSCPQTINLLYCYIDNLMVDNLMPSRLQIVH